jgi:hypothetical protein
MSDFGEFLKHLASESETSHEKYVSQEDARKALESFLSETEECDFKVGDFIERNQYGEKKYKFPSGNQAMKVLKILDDKYVSDENEHDGNVLVVCAIRKGIFQQFYVDSRFYRKSGSKKNVAFFDSFKKK